MQALLRFFSGYRPYFVLGGILFLFLSCNQNRRVKVYEVPNEVQPFVSSFIIEASKRGKRLIVDDLIITYKYNIFTSQVQAAGLCRRRFGHTPIIYIDTTTVNWKASKMAREQLVFHELCHCILDRGHKKDTLDNGNYASIMKPSGEVLYGDVLSKYKRDYYIDEIFNPNTSAPVWSFVDERYYEKYNRDTLYYENFKPAVTDSLLSNNKLIDTAVYDSIHYKDWSLGQNKIVRRWVQNGRLELETYQKGTYYIPFYYHIPTNENFEIRVKMMIVGNKKGQMALYWGGSSSKDAFVFQVNESGIISIGQVGKGMASVNSKLSINKSFYNELTIRKVDAFYYFYLNGQFIDNLMFEPFKGDLLGVGISGDATELWVNNILISHIYTGDSTQLTTIEKELP
ncbi:MAG: hypothetical protein M9887_06985 [Chitinophagales bacterium]|nr:hypothetical protein [Chitinophagales bacterium]